MCVCVYSVNAIITTTTKNYCFEHLTYPNISCLCVCVCIVYNDDDDDDHYGHHHDDQILMMMMIIVIQNHPTLLFNSIYFFFYYFYLFVISIVIIIIIIIKWQVSFFFLSRSPFNWWCFFSFVILYSLFFFNNWPSNHQWMCFIISLSRVFICMCVCVKKSPRMKSVNISIMVGVFFVRVTTRQFCVFIMNHTMMTLKSFDRNKTKQKTYS